MTFTSQLVSIRYRSDMEKASHNVAEYKRQRIPGPTVRHYKQERLCPLSEGNKKPTQE
ncbi:hypothetical protein M2305_002131 [Gluconobacter cerinus]|nr:hypothetical protein [Gluconobacter cerinus]